jgi:hypothetical protein
LRDDCAADISMMINLYAAWVGFLLGAVAGAVTGLFFYNEQWLGGYASWPRRMIRLAHIAFFGLGLLNLALALSARALGLTSGLAAASTLLIVGAVTMPLVCYLAAWRAAWRHLFFIPASSVFLAVAIFLWRILSL